MRTQYKAKVTDTGQKDNIVRDGVLTTQQAYDMFKRAGMTTKEWLEKTYKNVKQPTAEEMENIEKTVRKYKDKTDIQDEIKNIENNIEYTKIEKKELLKQQEIIKNKLAEIEKEKTQLDKESQ